LSHHLNNAEKIEKIAKINKHHAELFAYFLKKLATTPDGDGSLLDHSMILYGSSLSDGNQHLHHDLPTVLVGGANGKLKGGRHIQYEDETPMANLFLSMLDRVGVKPEAIGDSSGRVEHLSDLS
jgi:hypothetical protein